MSTRYAHLRSRLDRVAEGQERRLGSLLAGAVEALRAGRDVSDPELRACAAQQLAQDEARLQAQLALIEQLGGA